MTNKITEPMKKQFGGSPSCTEENMIFFANKLKELNDSDTKLTFRKWINKMMNLLDLIDQSVASIRIRMNI